MKRSGWALALAGIIGVAFFWATDPRLGIEPFRGRPDNLVDAVNEALIGTAVGIVGSVAILLVGLWLMTRRRV